MKKLVLVLTAILVLTCCLAFCACGDSLTEVNVERKFSRCDTHEKISPSVQHLMVNAETCSVYFRKSDDGKLTLSYLKNGKFDVSLEYKGTGGATADAENAFSAVVTQTCEKEEVLSGDDRYLVISIPKEAKVSLSCSIKTGTFIAMNIELESAQVIMETGSIAIKNCKVADGIFARTETGSIHVDAETEKLNVSAMTGSIHVEGEFEDYVFVRTNEGSVTVDCETGSLDIIVDTGTISFEAEADEIVIRHVDGTVNGKINGEKSQYTITLSTTSVCNLQEQSGSSKKTLSVQSDGVVNINFEK